MNQALLIIDAQQELIDGNEREQAVFNKEQLIHTINVVIKKAEQAKALIIFVRDFDVGDGEGKGFQVHKDIEMPKEYTVFDKLATNSFHGTGLLEYLKENSIEHLVVTGCKTQHCVDTAVRSATVHAMDVTLISDGHSTVDSKNLTAEQIINHHNEMLHGHFNVENFSVVRFSDEDVFTPTHDSYRQIAI